MVQKCVVCRFFNPYRPGSNFSEGERRNFHGFPKNIEQRQRWLEAIGMKKAGSKRRVCGFHFSDDDYKTSVVTGEKTILLKDTALPRFNLNPAERTYQSFNNAIESENIGNFGTETGIPEATINQQVLPTNPGPSQQFNYLYYPGQPQLLNLVMNRTPNIPVGNNEQIANLNEQNMETIKKGPTTIALAEDNKDNDKGKETAINQQVLPTNPGQPQQFNYLYYPGQPHLLNLVMNRTPNVPVENNEQIANLNEQNMGAIKKGPTTIDFAEYNEDNDKGKETDYFGTLKKQRIEMNKTTKSGKEIKPNRCLKYEKITRHDFISDISWEKFKVQKTDLQNKNNSLNSQITSLQILNEKLRDQKLVLENKIKLLESEKNSVTQESSSSILKS